MSSNIVVKVSISIGISSCDLLAPRLLSLRGIVPGAPERVRHLPPSAQIEVVGEEKEKRRLSQDQEIVRIVNVFATTRWNRIYRQCDRDDGGEGKKNVRGNDCPIERQEGHSVGSCRH